MYFADMYSHLPLRAITTVFNCFVTCTKLHRVGTKCSQLVVHTFLGRCYCISRLVTSYTMRGMATEWSQGFGMELESSYVGGNRRYCPERVTSKLSVCLSFLKMTGLIMIFATLYFFRLLLLQWG
jgi:hypothetical protein